MTTLDTPPSGFDEAAYLAANRDVEAFVREQKIPSGWSHFVSHGFDEYRPGVSVDVYRAVRAAKSLDCETAFPPPRLRKRVHGGDDAAGYVIAGRQLAANVLGQMAGVGFLQTGGRILDFGCGPGRVIMPLHEVIENMQLDAAFAWDGTDIDGEAIGWAQSFIYEIGRFQTNQTNPPLSYPDETFDFIYSISIFTHLPENFQFEWLEELKRVCKVGGHLVLTTHGENHFPPGIMQQQLREKGFMHLYGGGTQGLPAFYQTSYHDPAYIREKWSQYFLIEKIIPRGIAKAQDLVLCRRVG